MTEKIVIGSRFGEEISWYSSYQYDWTLDLNKTREAWALGGDPVPECRKKLVTISETTITSFLKLVNDDAIGSRVLRKNMLADIKCAKTWWDVAYYYPSFFFDFNLSTLTGCYIEGAPIHLRLPSGWTHDDNLVPDLPENIIPKESRYWLDAGRDLLKTIIQLPEE